MRFLIFADAICVTNTTLHDYYRLFGYKNKALLQVFLNQYK